MSDATNWKQYELMIQGIIRDALNELGEKVEEVVKGYIQRDVYDDGKAYRTTYEPTNQFKESFKKSDITKNPNNPEVLIKSDGKKSMTTYEPENFIHGSIYTKGGTEIEEDVRSYLAEILAFNHSGDLFGSGMWFHNRDSYYYGALDYLKSGGWLNKEFKKILRSKGLVVK